MCSGNCLKLSPKTPISTSQPHLITYTQVPVGLHKTPSLFFSALASLNLVLRCFSCIALSCGCFCSILSLGAFIVGLIRFISFSENNVSLAASKNSKDLSIVIYFRSLSRKNNFSYETILNEGVGSLV